MSSKHKRISSTVGFKLNVIKYAKEHGNRAAGRHLGPPPTERIKHEQRKLQEELQKLEKNKHIFIYILQNGLT
jgi:hypothetical protein